MTNTLNPWPWATPPSGIYFNMLFADYLAIPALQSSSIKQLLVSGPNFWAESWLNPFKKKKDTGPFAHGRAYHKRVLEGREAFYAVYAPAYEDDGNPDVLRSTEDIKQALVRMGLPSSFANKGEGAARLLASAPQKKIQVVLEQKYKAQFPGREFLAADVVREIELGARAIEFNQYLNHWLKGGYPEVTVIWYENGICFKIRFDYLKIGAAADLKTFANEKGKRIEKALDNAIASNKLFIQSGLYLRGAEFARQFAREGKIYGDDNVLADWLDLFAVTPVEEFRFIFHQKGQALVTDGLIHSTKNVELQAQASLRLDEAVETFRRFYGAFGAAPWVQMTPPRHIDFRSLPAFVGDL